MTGWMFCLLICGKLLFRVYGIVVSSLGTVVSSIGNGCAKNHLDMVSWLLPILLIVQN